VHPSDNLAGVGRDRLHTAALALALYVPIQLVQPLRCHLARQRVGVPALHCGESP
jgi:hypothetical protein